MATDVTSPLGLEMPSEENLLATDVYRIRNALTAIDDALEARPTQASVTAEIAAAVSGLASTTYVDNGLAAKAPTARLVNAGTGLAGGGDLSADRTLSLSTATQTSLGLADSSVQPSRSIFSGTGLTGGGNLSADRTLALTPAVQASLAAADAAVPQATQVIAGTGLSGGGALNQNVTLSLSAGTQASLALADTALQPGEGSFNYTVSATEPVTPAHGDFWLDTTDGIEYTYINDGTSSQWVQFARPGQGPTGPAGSVTVGTTTTGSAGSSASVTNTGTPQAAVLEFTIPRGDTGLQGLTGPMGPKAVSLVSPTNAEKVPLFWTTEALTVSKIVSLVKGSSSPSATFSVRYGTDFSAAGTEVKTGGITCTNTTTGKADTAFDSASIPANRLVWLTTSATSGLVDTLHVSVEF